MKQNIVFQTFANSEDVQGKLKVKFNDEDVERVRRFVS